MNSLQVVRNAEMNADNEHENVVSGLTKPVYTVKEVCEILQLSRYTIYDLIRQGRLRSKKIGAKTIRIPKLFLEEFLKNENQ